jgi:hypothetical protein
MMRKRHNQVLAGVLVVQIILVAVVFWPRPAATGGGALLADFQAADAVGLTIRDNQGNTVTMRKMNGTWVAPDVGDYPAQADTIDALLAKLAGLSANRLATRTAASHKQLQVGTDTFLRQVDLEMADGSTIRLFFGSSVGYSTTYARLDGHDETYLVDLTTSDLPAQLSGWVNLVYLQVDPDTVTAVKVRNAGGTLAFSRPLTGTWALADLPAGATLDPSRVSSLLQQVTTVRMARPLGKEDKPEYGMASPLAVVTLQTAEKEIVLTIGAQDPAASSYVVRSSESPYYVQLSSGTLRDVVERGVDGYLVPPPTVAPPPTVTP